YLRADVPDLISRVVVGRGAFDFWESGMDLRFGRNMFDSFVRYQSRLIRVFDSLAAPYNFQVIDASRPPQIRSPRAPLRIFPGSGCTPQALDPRIHRTVGFRVP